MKRNQKSITAKGFVQLLLDLNGLLTKEERQNPPLFKENTSRQYRYEQIKAIQGALEVNGSLEYLLNGDFIEKRGYNFYPNLEAQLNIPFLLKKYDPKKLKIEPLCLVDCARFTYARLLEYRVQIHSVLHLWSSALVGDPLLMLPFNLTQNVNSKIMKEIEGIDTKLAYFLDPANKRFTIKYLTENFGYPDVDIEMLDLDNF